MLTFLVMYFLAIVAAPFAVIVLAIAFLGQKLKLSDSEKPVSMIWLFMVAGSGMAINLLFIPFGLLWCWISGKPAPHPLD